MPQTIRPDDPCLSWAGLVSLEVADEWARPWRIPHEERRLFYPLALQEKAAMPSGVRIAFRSDATGISARFEPRPDMSPVDLCVDGEFVASTGALDGREEFRFEGLSAKKKLIELWLPMFGEFRLRSLRVSDGAFVAPYDDPRPRWITYGSSITMCRTAECPTQTWPAIVARRQGLNLTNLGYGGQCHLDPVVARMIRDLPADCVSFCFAANVYGSSSLNQRSFRPAMIGTVRTVREGHPRIPIVVMSCICLSGVEGQANQVGFTLDAMRQEVRAAVGDLRAEGDENIYYVDGTTVFGPEHAENQPDGVHPDAEGYKILGRNYLDRVASEYFPS